jgi:hypothetical protein
VAADDGHAHRSRAELDDRPELGAKLVEHGLGVGEDPAQETGLTAQRRVLWSGHVELSP